MHNDISLFVMPGCNMCPRMKEIFEDMHRIGAISELNVVDISLHPELAEKYNIKSVPFYLINGVGFNGVRTRQEIELLLQQNETQKWTSLLRSELIDGQLDTVEEYMQTHKIARVAMLELLQDEDTELVVRIGLTAVIESLVGRGLLESHEDGFIELTTNDDDRIAMDALYYLSLLSTPSSLQALTEIARNGKHSLREDARELLAESMCDRVLH